MDRSARRTVAVATSVAVMISGCGGGNILTPPTVTVRDTPSSSSRALPTASESASFVMPDLRGGNLQAAQDAIQALTGNPIFFSGSTDLTGQGRMQVLDRNWRVCSSTPAPGESYTSKSNVNFGVVKESESCP